MNFEFNIFGKKINYFQIKRFVIWFSKIGLILLILGSMLLLTYSVLLSPDDYNYTFVQGAGDRRRIDSIDNALETAKFFYNNWTGRVLPHVFIGIFRSLPEYGYVIINSFVFLTFIITINKVLNKKSSFFGILSVFGYLSFSMMFGEKFAWMSGSFNYLWPCTLLALFIYNFYNYFFNQKDLNFLEKIILVLGTFITAFTHENVAFVGGAFLVCILLFNFKKILKFEKKKKIVTILTYISFGLGAIANIFAPGNFKRLDSEGGKFSLQFLNNYKENKWILLVILLSIIIAFILDNKEILKKEKLKGIKKSNFDIVKIEFSYFILPSLIATLPMAVISYFPPRAFLAYEVMFMIVFSKNVCSIVKSLEKNDILIGILSIVFTLIVFGKFSPSTLAQINYLIPYKQKVTSQYEEALNNGEKDVLVSSFGFMNWIHKEDYINISNFFPELNYHMPVNALIAQYYGFDKVTAIGDNDYLVTIKVDTEGINPYFVIDKNTKDNIYTMEYDDTIIYTVPKDKYGIYLLDCSENGIDKKILDISIRYIGGELEKDKIKLEDIIIK